MPIVTIEYDDKTVQDEDMLAQCNGVQQIVSATTQIEDVSVYANSSRIKVKFAPIEVFVRISAHKVTDLNALMAEIKQKLSVWKTEHRFSHPINLTVIPMNWKFEIAI